MAPTKRPVEDRFREKLLPPNENGCVLWNGTLASTGYGQFWIDGRSVYAHRMALILQGVAIPPGYHVDHLCRIPRCVNPAHLEPVTPGENIRRGETFARANLLKTHCPKGHPLSGENLDAYSLRRGRRACSECMRQRCREWHHRNRDARIVKMKAYKARRKLEASA